MRSHPMVADFHHGTSRGDSVLGHSAPLCPVRLFADLCFDPVHRLIEFCEHSSKAAAILAYGFAELLWVN